jgi:hypothetical protein
VAAAKPVEEDMAIDGQTGRPALVKPDPFRAWPVRHAGQTGPGLIDSRALNPERVRHCLGLNVSG